MNVFIIGTDSDDAIFNALQNINKKQALNLALSFYPLPKLSDKFIFAFLDDLNNNNLNADKPSIIIAIIKNTPMLIKTDGAHVVKSHLNWQSLTKRITTAGRKSELILQACKLTPAMSVIDGTAGFGHDALILASTGASVMMMEKNPVVALLLFYEHEVMNGNVNWQKLLSRIEICYHDFLDEKFIFDLPKVDLVYLDPMFPNDSYSSKVNKNMQMLHQLANPPNHHDETLFLHIAQTQLKDEGKIIIKRPLSAPHLANKTPKQSMANDAIRFDRY